MKGIYYPSLLSLLEIYQHILEISQPKWCIMFAVNGIISLSPSWIYFGVYTLMGFPGGSNGKELPSMQETCVQFLGQKDPLEKEMETHSSIFAWRIPRTDKPGGLWSTGLQWIRQDWRDLARMCSWTLRTVWPILANGMWAEEMD